MYKSDTDISATISDSSERPPLVFHDLSVDDMRAEPRNADDWLWHGYLMSGQMTLLTAMWKTGKTTLLAGLLAKMKTGGDFCGRKVKRGCALVVSEEAKKKWLDRAANLDLSPQVRFLCEPFKGRPSTSMTAKGASTRALKMMELSPTKRMPRILSQVMTLTSVAAINQRSSGAMSPRR